MQRVPDLVWRERRVKMMYADTGMRRGRSTCVERGIERYAARKARWPCGTHVGETPNLMLGLAGIGHSYLRLYQPSIPSILILQKDTWRREQGDAGDYAAAGIS